MLLTIRYVDGVRVHKALIVIPVLFNSLLFSTMIIYFEFSGMLAYALLAIGLTVELLILFKARIWTLIVVSFGILIHLFAIRSIVIGINALVLGLHSYEIINNTARLTTNTMITLAAHIVVLVLFISFVPPNAVKKIIKNKTLLNNIGIIMTVLGLFFIFNARMLTVQTESNSLAWQQILLPIFLMGIFYSLLIFMIRLVLLDEYQKIIAELENKVDKNEMLSDALFNYAVIIVEFNCTKNKTERILVNSTEIEIQDSITITEFYENNIAKFTHPDDVGLMLNLNINKVTEAFNSGIKELSFDYRSYKIQTNPKNTGISVASDGYFWHKLRINSRLDSETNEIISICTIDEIHDEKEAEIALIMKTERDTLTGAYNKDAVKSNVSALLRNSERGILFIFDIDNFKGINDNMGHAFGDEVLIEIYNKVNTLFRSDDIIGRFGGDEFVAFISGDSTIENIEKLSKRICNTVEKTYTSDNGMNITISASIGVAIYPEHGATYDELFYAADVALYESKHRGKNTYTIFNKNMK